jgi:hypothetical protein
LKGRSRRSTTVAEGLRPELEPFVSNPTANDLDEEGHRYAGEILKNLGSP